MTAAAADAAVRWGAGASASRLVTGTLPVHTALESTLAERLGHEAALVHSTGYHANLSAVTALSDRDTLLVSDAHVHASLVDACRLSRGTLAIVAHNDLAQVEARLAERTQARALVLVESIYSVLGDAAPLAELVELCERYDATLVVDEAHGIGVAGDGGGLVRELGLAGRPSVIVTMTLSKALGSQGGAVLGSQAVVDHLVNRSRPFIYDTGLAPAAAAAALEALRIMDAEPERVARLHHVAATLADAAGVPRVAGAVLSVEMPGPAEALAAQAECARERRTRRLLPAAVDPRRHQPAAAHGIGRSRRRRAHAGRQAHRDGRAMTQLRRRHRHRHGSRQDRHHGRAGRGAAARRAPRRRRQAGPDRRRRRRAR